MDIHILYDNNSMGDQFRPDQGFAVLISTEDRTILFDTGKDPGILFYNMEKFDVDPEDIDIVVISHEHEGHFGSLEKLLKLNDNVALYIPRSMSQGFKDNFRALCSIVMEVAKPTLIHDGVYCTGDCIEEINEQSLVVQSDPGLVVFMGCAHHGLASVLDCAQSISADPIHLVLGGLHLSDADSKVLESIKVLKQHHVKSIAPGNCTPPRARKILKQAFQDDFIEIGVGKSFEL